MTSTYCYNCDRSVRLYAFLIILHDDVHRPDLQYQVRRDKEELHNSDREQNFAWHRHVLRITKFKSYFNSLQFIGQLNSRP